MKNACKVFWQLWPPTACALGFLLMATEVLAAENANNWRPTYDLVLMWVNFGIFAFILVKYSRKPLVNFLKGQKEKIDLNITRIEERKETILAEVRVANDALDESKMRMQKLKERIVLQGERRKQEIIENAKQESKILIEGIKKKIENQLFEAKNAYKSELVDMAISLALERLPDEITAEDNQQLIDQFLVSSSAK